MSKDGSIDIRLGDVAIHTSFALTGDTRFQTLTIHKNAVLNMRKHRFIVDHWSHIEGRIVSVGPGFWSLIKLWFWIKRQIDEY